MNFPKLSEAELKILFKGSYQLYQAVSYLAEMYNEDDTINVNFLREKKKGDVDHVLKIEVQSKHIKSKKYRCLIKYRPNVDNIRGIIGHACECANGLPTVGCCSHKAAIVYFLSHALYLAKVVRSAEILTSIFDREGYEAVIEEDSNED